MAGDAPVIVITGASRGLGRGLAEHFVNRGYRVAGCSRGASTLDHSAYSHSQLDVTDERAVQKWVRTVRREIGAIDVLVCNAGAAKAARLLTMTDGSMLDEVIRSNVYGTYFVCREVARSMMTARAGRIVTISSMAVGIHQEGTSAYGAAKAAIVEMTKVLARELAPHGITANVVAPSMYASEAFDMLGESVQERAKGKLTLPRLLTVHEIANVVEFFAAPESRAVTGQVIHLGLVV